jgi:hypothetical protein
MSEIPRLQGGIREFKKKRDMCVFRQQAQEKKINMLKEKILRHKVDNPS